MGKEILKKYEEYIQRRSSEIKLANELRQNYQYLMGFSDEELRRTSNPPTIFGEDPVYNKIWDLRGKVFFQNSLRDYFYESLRAIENRTMKEDEYNYFLNNSHEQILKDKNKEFYPKRNLFQRFCDLFKCSQKKGLK